MFELLSIFPRTKFEEIIKAVRQQQFQPNNGLRHKEVKLINMLLAPEPEDRPGDVSEIMNVITYLKDLEEGKNTYTI